jgi:hypothetical protein
MCPVVVQLSRGAGGPDGWRDDGGGGPDGGVWAARPGHAPPAGQAGRRLPHRRQDPPHLQPAHQHQGRGSKLKNNILKDLERKRCLQFDTSIYNL